jgi:hypothetical protein
MPLPFTAQLRARSLRTPNRRGPEPQDARARPRSGRGQLGPSLVISVFIVGVALAVLLWLPAAITPTNAGLAAAYAAWSVATPA